MNAIIWHRKLRKLKKREREKYRGQNASYILFDKRNKNGKSEEGKKRERKGKGKKRETENELKSQNKIEVILK